MIDSFEERERIRRRKERKKQTNVYIYIYKSKKSPQNFKYTETGKSCVMRTKHTQICTRFFLFD